MKYRVHFSFLASALLICSQVHAQTTSQETRDSDAQRPSATIQEAVDLLQSAAVYAARGKNAEAEECCRQLLDNPELLDHVDPLKVRALMGACIRKQDRYAEAFEILKAVLKEQRAKLGDEHSDAESTARVLDALTIDMTWSQSLKPNRPAREYDEAITVAEEAVALNLPNAHWQLALLKLRSGDRKAGLEAIGTSLREDQPWLGQFPILAMVLLEGGKEHLARDAYAVSCDRIAKLKSVWKPIQQVHDQATEQLGMGDVDPATDMSREELVAAYTRLIEAYPGVARLHAWRANHLGCLGRREEAVEDLAKASQLAPDVWRFGEGLAVLRLESAGPDQQTKLCRDLCNDCLQKDKYGPRGGDMDLVLLCSLAANADLDRRMLLTRADEILEKTPTRPFLELSRGMALYRCGRYEAAFDVLPGDDARYSNVKDQTLALIFRAMTHYRLGDKFAAKRLLQTAGKLHRDEFASSPVVRMPYQDAAVVDCMIRIALKEAEEMIRTEEK